MSSSTHPVSLLHGDCELPEVAEHVGYQDQVAASNQNSCAPFEAIEFGDASVQSLWALSRAIRTTPYLRAANALPYGETQADDQVATALKCKRVIDLMGAVFILLCVLPLLILCASLVAASSPGPIFFRHKRLGRNGQEFFIWKFRTMCANPDAVLSAYLKANPEAQEEWQQTQKLVNDPRVTSAGRFLRRFSLDEFPQLWNVIKGEMSLIGPRPIVRNEVEKYGLSIGAYYAVRPGMTGLWQVSGRSDTTYNERVRLDTKYSREWSLGMDWAIFLQTFRVVISGSGAY